MNKRHIHLFATLFLVSAIISSTILEVYATPDSTTTTTVTYNALSASERNNYTINIPSSVEMINGSAQLNITVSDVELEDDYTVYVDVDKSTLNGTPTTTESHDHMLMYIDSNKKYYYAVTLSNSKNSTIFYRSDASGLQNLNVATFGSTESKNTGGILNLEYNEKKSNDKSNHDAATYTGTITFKIYGKYDD
jgi:hypothetical protein